jgi:hypothetical protein
VGAFAGSSLKSWLLSNVLAETVLFDWFQCDKLICAASVSKRNRDGSASNCLLVDTLFDNLTSNQVGLPAELKHINKRRKRN